MRLGLHIGYWTRPTLGPGAAEALTVVREAERLGYDSVWTAEAYGSDAATVLGWLAQATETIGLGAGVMQIPARSAAMTAMTAATLDGLSGGRFRLGLGPSGPQVAEGWHGRPFARQLQRTREYVEVVRMALARERVEYHGETLELPLPGGAGRPLKLTIAPVQERIPIYLAAIGPRATALAAEIGDGWLPFLFSPTHVSEFRPQLEAGFAARGGEPAAFDVAPMVSVRIDDDLDAARDALRPMTALYVGGMGSRERNFYNAIVARYGFEAAAAEVQDHYLAGRREAAMAALPGDLLDAVTLCGPPDRVRARLEEFRAAGVGTLVASFVGDDRLGQVRALAALAG